MKIVAIIQARMGSTRLPGKIMMDLAGRPLLMHVVNRVCASRGIDEVIVATTTKDLDDVVERFCQEHSVKCFRGDEQDVLNRFYQTAKDHVADIIIRVTADCPLLDPQLLSAMIEQFVRRTAERVRVDYLSNTLKRTYPRGLDAEIFSFAALEKAWKEARQPEDREHVTSYIWKHPEHFYLQNYSQREDLSFHRWTVDVKEDLAFIQLVYTALYQPQAIFSTIEVLKFLNAHPELLKLNMHVQQKEVRC